jgi:predicted transport protein
MRLGLVDEDEEVQATADRSYWEARANKHTLAMVDELLAVVRALDPELDLKYNKFYIGLAKGGQPNNFVIFKPKKEWLRLEVRLDRSDEMQAELDSAGVDVMDYDSHWGRYRIRLARGDTAKHKDFLAALIGRACRGAA